MSEEWREFMPGYEVSSLGGVRRSETGRRTFAGRVLKPFLMAVGYMAVRPVINGRNVHVYIHDAVAAAFIGPKPEGFAVNHIDGVKTNNTPQNLEYVSHAQNMRHASDNGLLARGERHPSSKLTEASVRALRADRVGGMPFSKLAAKHGVSVAVAFSVANRKSWRHVA